MKAQAFVVFDRYKFSHCSFLDNRKECIFSSSFFSSFFLALRKIITKWVSGSSPRSGIASPKSRHKQQVRRPSEVTLLIAFIY